MERVVIVGSAGAGKTDLATRLSRRTGLPIVHLDLIFWGPGWSKAPLDEALERLAAAVSEDRWILDGNFLSLGDEDVRFERADTVIFLDLPRLKCLWRVLWRLVRDRRRDRVDLPAGCGETFDANLLRWVWRYPKIERPRVLARLDDLDRQIQVHQLRSGSDVRQYLSRIPW
jgi:adenylate kinase family enzyme